MPTDKGIARRIKCWLREHRASLSSWDFSTHSLNKEFLFAIAFPQRSSLFISPLLIHKRVQRVNDDPIRRNEFPKAKKNVEKASESF